jgi:Common central domain of tyrosinase
VLAGTGYGLLERNPHSKVRSYFGGIMDTFRSPPDSVFWTHHNMIERD